MWYRDISLLNAQAAQVYSVGAACASAYMLRSLDKNATNTLGCQRNARERRKNELPYPCVEFQCTSIPLNCAMLIKLHVSM